MKKYWLHACLAGIATAWGLFSYAYLGVEDGSSGLSPLGWIQTGFFLPGGFLVTRLHGGSYTNADLPIMAFLSWLIFLVIAVGLAHSLRLLRKRA